MSIEKDYRKWNEFLEKWPLSKVKEMTLEEYTNSGANDSFTYWMEKELDTYGSIWGGSAFNFGVFNRYDKSVRYKKESM